MIDIFERFSGRNDEDDHFPLDKIDIRIKIESDSHHTT